MREYAYHIDTNDDNDTSDESRGHDAATDSPNSPGGHRCFPGPHRAAVGSGRHQREGHIAQLH
jgi:hypothetical protein